MLRSWAAHTYPKFMRVLRWGIDLAQLYTNGGTGMCIGLQSSLEGNGVATSNSGPFEKFGGCRGGPPPDLDQSQNPSDMGILFSYYPSDLGDG